MSDAQEQQALAQFAKHYGLEYPLAVEDDNNNMHRAYAVQGIPQVVLIDRKEIVRLVRVGSSGANMDDIGKMIEKLLAE